MKREVQLEKLKQNSNWDIIIIGGGATGLGIAIDSASRGYKTILLEAVDFAKGTSSRSTKLAHGGVRYLEQFNFSLVREALLEREFMIKNAQHLVKDQRFVIPIYSLWSSLFYSFGLQLYDFLAGKSSFGASKKISKEKTVELLPTIEQKGLRNGIIYHDGQFDDARLAINLAQTAIENGACVLNYAKVVNLLKNNQNQVCGVEFENKETNESKKVSGKVIINATGVFSNSIINMNGINQDKLIIPSQGIHLVFEKSVLPTSNAMMIPKTSDGRVLFIIPWHDKIMIGTTDTLITEPILEPKPFDEEIDFLIETANKYLSKKIKRNNVLSVFVGLRPLAIQKNKKLKTKEISRSHQISISDSGLISVTGGKWTTYRKIAEDVLNRVIITHNLPFIACKTKKISIYGNKTTNDIERENHLYIYGTDSLKIIQLQESKPELKEKLHPNYPYTLAEVIWAIRNEMARTVEDVLARRVRLLFLDASAAIECSEKVGELLAEELNQDAVWKKDQIVAFKKLAKGYLIEH